MNRFAYLEEWLRREPSHNSVKVWIDENLDIALWVCDFNGNRVYIAPTIVGAIDEMRKGEG